MDEPDNTLSPAPKSLRRFIQPALGYLVAAACLFWVLHDVHPREILKVSANIQWRWVTAAIAFDILSYICQGWRWQLLLRPVGRISLVRTTQAIYVGLFTMKCCPCGSEKSSVSTGFAMDAFGICLHSAVSDRRAVLRRGLACHLHGTHGSLHPIARRSGESGRHTGRGCLGGDGVVPVRGLPQEGRPALEAAPAPWRVAAGVGTSSRAWKKGKIGFSKGFFICLSWHPALFVIQSDLGPFHAESLPVRRQIP